MAKLSLFRGSSTAVTNRDVTDGQLLVDLTNNSLYTDVGNTRTLLSENRNGAQADWTQSTTSSVDYIKNKPTKLNQFDDTLRIYGTTEPTIDLVDNKTRWFGGDGRVDLTFINMDGSTYKMLRRTPGDAFPSVGTPTATGYDFDHWYPSFPNVVPNEDSTYEAVPVNEVSLTFLGYDGSVYMEITAYPGNAFPTISDPTHEGSRFLGWSPNLPNVVPDSDTTYDSEWLDKITLSFLGYGGSEYITLEEFPGDTFPTVIDPTHTNSRFLGWSPSLPGIVPSEDTTYESSWLDAVTLTFLGYGGSVYTTQTVYPGDSFPTITNPTHTNSRFLGWSPSLPSVVPNQNTTYTSTWLNAINLYFYNMKYDPSPTFYLWKTTVAYPGDTFPNPGNPPELIGSPFLGWSPSLPAKVPSSNASYYAQY